jgi:hypothetical protein
VTESLDTGQVRRTWNSGCFSYKVGGTLEENLLRRGGPCNTIPSTHVCTIRVDC